MMLWTFVYNVFSIILSVYLGADGSILKTILCSQILYVQGTYNSFIIKEK